MQKKGSSLTLKAVGGGAFFASIFSFFFDISPEPLRRSSPNFQYPFAHCDQIFFPKAMISWPLRRSDVISAIVDQKKSFAGRAVRSINLIMHKNVQDMKCVELPGLLYCSLDFVFEVDPKNKKK